jgi:hypothetical protein
MLVAWTDGVSVAVKCSAGSILRTASNRSGPWPGFGQSNLNRNHLSDSGSPGHLRIREVKVSNDELAELLVWAYKQGFLDAAQVLTESVKSLDDAKIRAQLLAGLEALSKPVAPDKPEAEGSE